jgi:UDP-N-acetylmuramoyl-L-alanyl-D-glutamate--2,6-diaminopimelate ligase
MGRIAQDLADHIVITSDNPRSENPQQIIEDILTGLDATGLAKSAVEPDRRKAIHQGIELARDGDVVLIAGKGHESYQVVGGRKKHLDDVEVAEECIRLRSSAEETEV